MTREHRSKAIVGLEKEARVRNVLTPEHTRLCAEVRRAVPLVWKTLSTYVTWPVDAEGAAALCLVAGRPVTWGGMSGGDYTLILLADPDLTRLIHEWAADALHSLL